MRNDNHIQPFDGYEGLYWSVMRAHAADYKTAYDKRDIRTMRSKECLMRAWVEAVEGDDKVVDTIIKMLQGGVDIAERWEK